MRASTDDALALARELGLTGSLIVLADVLPLVEMAWADGAVQPEERAMILAFLDAHLDGLAASAGREVVDRSTALTVIGGLLDRRPDPRLLAGLRRNLPFLGTAQRLREGVLAVASSAPSPTTPAGQWDTAELELWFDIDEDLEGLGPARAAPLSA